MPARATAKDSCASVFFNAPCRQEKNRVGWECYLTVDAKMRCLTVYIASHVRYSVVIFTNGVPQETWIEKQVFYQLNYPPLTKYSGLKV